MSTEFTRTRKTGISAIYWTVTSGLLVIPGVARTKAAATFFDFDGLALFGQVSQLQTLLVSIGAIGLTTAARIALSRQSLAPQNRRRMAAWLLYWPTGISAIFSAGAMFFSPFLSSVITGDPGNWPVVAIAALGIPFAVATQQCIAIAQSYGETSRLLSASAIAATLGAASIFFLMFGSDATTGAISFLVAPLIQFIVVASFLKPIRLAIRTRPSASRSLRAEVLRIGAGSAVLGSAAAGADLGARSAVVGEFGLDSIAAFQPVVLIVTQLFGLALSALATSSMVTYSSSSKDQIGETVRALVISFVPLVGILSALGIAFSPLLVSVFFTNTLIDASVPLIALALSGEVLRSSSWLVGSALLPVGARRAWLTVGMLTVTVQFAVGVSAGIAWGALGLVIGVTCANLFAVVAQVIAVRRVGINISVVALFLPIFISIALFISFAATYEPGSYFIPGALIPAGLIAGLLAIRSFLGKGVRAK